MSAMLAASADYAWTERDMAAAREHDAEWGLYPVTPVTRAQLEGRQEPSLADEVRISLAIARMRWKTEGLAAAAASLLRSGSYLEHFYGGPAVADRIAEIPLKAVTA